MTVMDKIRGKQKKNRKKTLGQAFGLCESYDKGKDTVQIKDMERLLYESGLKPKNRAEQQHIREMVEEVDDDGDSDIGFKETEDLYQRIVENMYKKIQEEIKHLADSLGYTAESLAELQ